MLTLADDAFERIARLMHQACGLSFGQNKKPLVSSRLAAHIQRLGLASFDDYAALLSQPAEHAELQTAIDLLTTNETYFFREPAHYELLQRELTRLRPRRVAAWSAAASFGDEAYSTAMLLADLQQQGRIGNDWSVLGTDISDRVLRSAAEAVFPQERLREVSEARLRRYCLRGEGDC